MIRWKVVLENRKSAIVYNTSMAKTYLKGKTINELFEQTAQENIDSITVNADVASEIAQYISELEKGTDKEPRNYIPEQEKKVVEQDIREIAGITEEDAPVILDLESVRVTGAGKFEIDIVNLFRKDRPLIYKLEEGKYIIDLASTLERNMKDLKEIVNPNKE